MKKHIIVCYDISNNKRRYRLDKYLCHYGERIQYSIFQVLVADHAFNAFRENIISIIDAAEDTINYYTICHWCSAKVVTLGTAHQANTQGYFYQD